MAYTLQEYVDWLDEREDLQWPVPPAPEPPKATPSVRPLPGIRAVTWSVYGTLLRISEGRLLFEHPQPLPMQVALEKTIQEFHMWPSMTRRPGEPWKQLREESTQLFEKQRMTGTGRKGEFPEVDSAGIWLTVLDRLRQKDYEYDRSFYGAPEEFAQKVAYFFHASLQGAEAAPNALAALQAVAESPARQGLLAEGQAFTLIQLLRALKQQGTLPPPGRLFDLDCVTLSFREGVRKPSSWLYQACLERFAAHGIEAGEVLHVGTRLRDDLAVAKEFGMRTALYAGDRSSLEATKADVRDPELKPDRLLTDLAQIGQILEVGG